MASVTRLQGLVIVGIAAIACVAAVALSNQPPLASYNDGQKWWALTWSLYGVTVLIRLFFIISSPTAAPQSAAAPVGGRKRYWLNVLSGLPEIVLAMALTVVAGRGFVGLSLDSFDDYIGVTVSIIVTLLSAHKP